MTSDQLRYPIGKFEKPKTITENILEKWISEIAGFPEKIRKEVSHLTDEQLDTPYRPGGWTIRQVVNHCADSHMNALTRMKLALTEDQPTIKPYEQDRWAELADSKSMPVEPALKMIEGIHERWVNLLSHLTEEQNARTFIHPEGGEIFRIDEKIGGYAWHGNHHLAHITEIKKRNNWK